jgi:hypothetical protein
MLLVTEVFESRMYTVHVGTFRYSHFYIPVRLPTDSAESTYWEENLWSYGQMQTESMDFPGLQMSET